MLIDRRITETTNMESIYNTMLAPYGIILKEYATMAKGAWGIRRNMPDSSVYVEYWNDYANRWCSTCTIYNSEPEAFLRAVQLCNSGEYKTDWIKKESEKILNFIDTSSEVELNEALKKAGFKKQMNLQLTTIGSFQEAKDLIDALNKLGDKRLACRITRRIHNYYHKSFYLSYRVGKTEGLTETEYTLKLQELFVTTYNLGPVHKNARKANIPYLYIATVSKLHNL